MLIRQYLLKGYIPLKQVKIGRLFAAPLDGKTGGLPFELYQNYTQLIRPMNVLLKKIFFNEIIYDEKKIVFAGKIEIQEYS